MEKKDPYIGELISNLGRFVEGSFTPLPAIIIKELPPECYISQNICGDYNAATAIYGTSEAIYKFAIMYSQMELEEGSELIGEIAADFLNMHNGHFVVNLSKSENIESTLEPPIFNPEYRLSISGKTINVIPIQFDFGIINFVLAE